MTKWEAKTGLGYALVGDLGRFEIERMWLDGGLLWMSAWSYTPVKFGGGECMVRFYSPDGKVAGITGNLPLPPWDLGPNPGAVHLQFSMQLVSSLPGQPYMQLVER